MTVQIYMRGTRVWKIANDGATATSATATVFHYSPGAEPKFMNYENWTPATASVATASIVIHDTYNVYDNPVPILSTNA